jgi:hypothetical protein
MQIDALVYYTWWAGAINLHLVMLMLGLSVSGCLTKENGFNLIANSFPHLTFSLQGHCEKLSKSMYGKYTYHIMNTI